MGRSDLAEGFISLKPTLFAYFVSAYGSVFVCSDRYDIFIVLGVGAHFRRF